MKVILSGYYGFGNVGDEAALAAMVQKLQGHDLTVLSASPQLTKEFYQVNAIYRYDWRKIFDALKKTDLFISGGGTLFQNITSGRSLVYYAGLILLAKLLGKRAVVLGQGFGPLRGFFTKLVVRFVLKRADLITLRDKESFDRVAGMGIANVCLTADPSLLLAVPSPEEGSKILKLEGVKKGERPVLGIALRPLVRGEGSRLYESIATTIDWLVKEYNYAPVFILFHAPADMAAVSKVIKYMQSDSSIVFRICKPGEMLALVSQLDLVIGMRLHSLIFSAMTNVPMLGISYDPKVEAFMKSIDQPYLLFHEEPDFEQLKHKLEGVLINKDQIKADLRIKMGELREKAQLNFELLFR